MSKPAAALPNLLRHTVSLAVNVDTLNVDTMKGILKPILGSAATQKLRAEECRRMLKEVFADPARVRRSLDDLTAAQRQILAICQRHGGAVTGGVLLAEAAARGLLEAEREPPRPAYEFNKNDPILALCNRMLLVSWDGRFIGRHRYDYGYFGARPRYSDATLHPALVEAVEPAEPLPWPTPPAKPPATVQLRSTAEVAFDLWNVAQALHESEPWKTNKGGTLPKATQNRVRKVLPSSDGDALAPPDAGGLYYELLRGLDVVEVVGNEGRLDRAAVRKHLDRPAVQQSWRLVQAWMNIALWQDGIGIVPDRDSDSDPVRIYPRSLLAAKELVVWALQAVAQGPNDWLDLTAFLVDCWERTRNGIDFYWSNYSWQPRLQVAAPRSGLSEQRKRELHFWLPREGTWIANALCGTLGHLGLVECGDVDQRPRFRLTPLGRAVFAAPETTPLPETTPHFLTVQPNHEIVAYLNNADAAAVWPLARMAQRVSTASGLVQTFALTRDSVYQALESGLTLDRMRQFLREHSTTGLPDNVAASLVEWSRKREALTLRTGVTLLVAPSEPPVLLAKPIHADKKPEVVVDHRRGATVCWRVKEDGRVRVDKKADAVALARLSQFADAEGEGETWRISALSVARARAHGLRAEQLLGWLEQHTDTTTPPLLETRLRNWTDGGSVFLGELLLLQVPQEQACLVLREQADFQHFFLAHLAPNWFIVHPGKRAELEQLLRELGFATLVSWKPPAPTKAEPEKAPPRKKRRRS